MGTAKNAKLEQRDLRTAARNATAQNDGWRGFVNVDLSAEDKQALKAGATPFEDWWDGVLDRMIHGYKLSVSFDHRNDTWLAALTCNHPADANRGYTLTGRGARWADAVSALAYKDRLILRGDWAKWAVGSREAGPVDFG